MMPAAASFNVLSGAIVIATTMLIARSIARLLAARLLAVVNPAAGLLVVMVQGLAVLRRHAVRRISAGKWQFAEFLVAQVPVVVVLGDSELRVHLQVRRFALCAEILSFRERLRTSSTTNIMIAALPSEPVTATLRNMTVHASSGR